MTKSIWIPKSELKVTVSDGKVRIWDEMTMQEKPLASQPAGFSQFPRPEMQEIGKSEKRP